LVTAQAEEIIVLAGGLGTRLRSELGDLPKPLAPVSGRPFLAHLLDQLSSCGFRRAILAVGYRHEQIRAAIGEGWRGMEIRYCVETAPLGTGGAVAKAVTLAQGSHVFLANGDTFLRFAPDTLKRLVADTGAAIGMVLAQVPDVSRYGAVEVENDLVAAFREKGGSGPGFINAGSYLLTEEARASFPDRDAFSFEEDVLRPMAAAGKVAALPESADFIDIGIPVDFHRASSLFGGTL
jgi:D-glycero-alpha-D-manno-heptose 1-phosphate guanylyltransferase